MSSATSEKIIHVHQGDFVVSSDRGVVLATILGSCVAACIYDPVTRIGGMNHFLLPDNSGGAPGAAANRYGVHLMELLVNGLLKAGAMRENLEAKVFGGGRLVRGLSDIGARNADFALKFLTDEGIRITAQSLKGDRARRVQFWPTTGRTRQMLLNPNEAVPVEVSKPKPVKAPSTGDVDLF